MAKPDGCTYPTVLSVLWQTVVGRVLKQNCPEKRRKSGE